MYEKEIVQEMITLMHQHRHAYAAAAPPKVTLKIPQSLEVDLVCLASLFDEERQRTTFQSVTFCINSCKSTVFYKDCGRQYRGPFLFDMCQRCRGSHFELDDHLQVSVEAPDRRVPHKPHKEVWQMTLPVH